jgi:hypothetical protein
MNIVSMGRCRPTGRISNDVLDWTRASDTAAVSSVSHLLGAAYSLDTCLPISYITSTYNEIPKNSVEVVKEGATFLGYGAAIRALEEANLVPADLGLVVAETSSQTQTIPGESQRIAEKLGLKVVSFDFSMSACSFVNYLRTLMSWKPERLPKYTLCVSVHTPTRFVDYKEGPERFILGDGAYAMILSPNIPGIARVERTWWMSQAEFADVMSLSLFGHIHIDLELLWTIFERQLLDRLRDFPARDDEVMIFPSLFYDRIRSSEHSSLFGNSRLAGDCYKGGFALGADIGLSVSRILEQVTGGTRVRVFGVDGGGTFGEAVIIKEP